MVNRKFAFRKKNIYIQYTCNFAKTINYSFSLYLKKNAIKNKSFQLVELILTLPPKKTAVFLLSFNILPNVRSPTLLVEQPPANLS